MGFVTNKCTNERLRQVLKGESEEEVPFEDSGFVKRYMKGKTIIIVSAILSIVFLTICTYQFLKRRGQLLSRKKRAGDEEEQTEVAEQPSNPAIALDQEERPSDVSAGAVGESSMQHN